MKKTFKPARIAFYLLLSIVFFFFGLYLAKITGAGKNQGLAGGAIVLGYGVLSGGLAFVSSFFIAHYVVHHWIVKLNWILLILIVALYGYTHYSYLERQKAEEQEHWETNSTTSATTPTASSSLWFKNIAKNKKTSIKETATELSTTAPAQMGMGFFKPNYYEHPVLYFYGMLTPGKSLSEHAPIDSITFSRNEHHQFEITTAPPWLQPHYSKLDYDLFFLKVKSITSEILEVVVNETSEQTAFVDRGTGKFMYWPDFLLGVHSMEFLEGSAEKVKVKPLDYAGNVATTFEYMRPLKIKGDWMEVTLWDQNYQTVGRGWIPWERDGKLLVRYHMLS